MPEENYIVDTGQNKLTRLLSTNQCCMVVDHRQGGKSTLAALAAKELDNCYVVLFEALKVGSKMCSDLHMTVSSHGLVGLSKSNVGGSLLLTASHLAWHYSHAL